MATKATDRQIKCAKLLVLQGMHPTGAAACTGNFSQESGINLPTAFRTGKLDHGSQGLAQWRLDRLVNYERFVHSKHPTLSEDEIWPWYGRLDYQTEFVAIEMKQTYPVLWAKLVKGGDVGGLAADVCWQYERPSRALSGITNRINQAKLVYAGLPKVTSTGVQTDITSALADHIHDNQATAGAGVAVAGSAGVMGGLLAIVPNLPTMPTWEIVCVVLIGFLVITGICMAIVGTTKAATIKAAVPHVNTSAPRGGHADPIIVTTDKPATVTPPGAALVDAAAAKRAADLAEQQRLAAQDESDAITKALNPAPAPAPAPFAIPPAAPLQVNRVTPFEDA